MNFTGCDEAHESGGEPNHARGLPTVYLSSPLLLLSLLSLFPPLAPFPSLPSSLPSSHLIFLLPELHPRGSWRALRRAAAAREAEGGGEKSTRPAAGRRDETAGADDCERKEGGEEEGGGEEGGKC
eukprot:22980-Hanusia_phi.AAC.1